MNKEIIKDLFEQLNESVPYVILRNWEEIYSQDSNSLHGDIDILCEDLNDLKKHFVIVPIHNNVYRDNYYVIFQDNKIRVDIRHVGDGYYPSELEKQLLNNRVLSKEGFYIPDARHYYYSLLYHALLQKKSISYEYADKLKSVRCQFAGNIIDSENSFIDQLRSFAEENNLIVPMPLDPGVYINYSNAKSVGMSFDIKPLLLRFQFKLSVLFTALLNKI